MLPDGGRLIVALEEGGDLGQPAVGILARPHVAVEPDARVGVDPLVQPVARGGQKPRFVLRSIGTIGRCGLSST